jgi:pimeloyl-ACP methyl ester carboxylesterase
MTSFVLVHGAFRGGWAWRSVRPHLLAAGYDVHAPSLLGSGEHAHLVDRVTDLQVWVDQVRGLVELEDLADVVLVGHSQGGLVTAAVAAAVPERIAALVHLDAAVPAPGERAVDLGPVPATLPPRSATVPAPPPGEEYDPATRDWVAARLCDGPVGPALDPVPAVDGVREVYAFCERTPAGYPSRATRERVEAEGREFVVLDAGHDAPLSAPRAVADLLLGVAAPGRGPGAARAPEAS